MFYPGWSCSMWHCLCNFDPESSSDEEKSKKPAAKAAPVKAVVAKATAAGEDSSEDDSSSDEEETAQKPAAKSAPIKTASAKKESSSSGKMKTFYLTFWTYFGKIFLYFLVMFGLIYTFWTQNFLSRTVFLFTAWI